MLPTINIFSELPGCILLITEPGVGAQAVPTIGLIEHGNAYRSDLGDQSYFSFAETHLGLTRLLSPENAIDGLGEVEIQLSGVVLTPGTRAQQFLATPWEAIFRSILENPRSLEEFTRSHRRFEEFIAETYYRSGYKVELTPASNDGGVDIIAELPGHGTIKILDQTKAYSEHRPVTANDVRAAVAVLATHPDASKAVVTTTSRFAPGVFTEFASMTPTRLELRDGQKLIEWLKTVAEGS